MTALLAAILAGLSLAYLPAPGVPEQPKPGQRIECVDTFTGGPPICYLVTGP